MYGEMTEFVNTWGRFTSAHSIFVDKLATMPADWLCCIHTFAGTSIQADCATMRTLTSLCLDTYTSVYQLTAIRAGRILACDTHCIGREHAASRGTLQCCLETTSAHLAVKKKSTGTSWVEPPLTHTQSILLLDWRVPIGTHGISIQVTDAGAVVENAR